jgi:hypothetical protein
VKRIGVVEARRLAKFADPEIADAVTLARAMSREPVAAGDRLRASTFSQG